MNEAIKKIKDSISPFLDTGGSGIHVLRTRFQRKREAMGERWTSRETDGYEEFTGLYASGTAYSGIPKDVPLDSIQQNIVMDQWGHKILELRNREIALMNDEVVLALTIQRLLDTQSRVIALDIGGGKGLTWIKLAAYFSEAVDSGQLVLVVSNVVFDPDRDSNQMDPQRRDSSLARPLSQQSQQLWSNYYKKIHFLQGDMKAVNQGEVVVNGESVSLLNNVSLLHDSGSIAAHSMTLDQDTLYALGCLSPRGVWFGEACTHRAALSMRLDREKLRPKEREKIFTDRFNGWRRAMQQVEKNSKYTFLSGVSVNGVQLERVNNQHFIIGGREAPELDFEV